MGSPFTARLCRLLAERLAPGDPVSDRVLGWPGDPSNRADALPLRLAGALHGLVVEGRDAGLAAVYPPHHAAADDDAALGGGRPPPSPRTRPFVLARLDGPPQTNETQRSAALAPGFLTVAALTGLPLVTSEIGASAGLNLIWDRFAYAFGAAAWGDPASPVAHRPRLAGPAAAAARPPIVAERAGCDRAPPDLGREADRLRLLSFVWADQTARMARTAAAIELARAAGVRVERADAADWLAARLADAARRAGRTSSTTRSSGSTSAGRRRTASAASLDAAGARGDARRAARLAAHGGRRRRARRRDHPDPLARRRDPPARPRRLPRRLGPLDGLVRSAPIDRLAW